MNIRPVEETVQQLFQGRRYKVPEYQRAFSWGDDQIDEFWGDVSEADVSGHFLGPMVLHDLGQGNQVEVVDGQQRLTTIQMLLALFRDKFVELGDPTRPGQSSGYSSAPQSLIRPTGYYEGASLQLSPSQRSTFEKFVSLAPANGDRLYFSDAVATKPLDARQKSLMKAWLRLKSSLDARLEPLADNAARVLELAKLEEKLTTRVQVMSMIVTELDDAFLLFESLNDRGLGLSAADLLKSHLLGKMEGTDRIEALTEWDEVVDQLGGKDISSFLRHYLLAQGPGRVKKDNVYPKFRELVTRDGAANVLESLIKWGGAYAQLRAPARALDDDIRDMLFDLNGPKVDSQRILLVKALTLDLPKPSLSKLARAVETLSFRWTITGGNAQELENFYQERALQLTSASDVDAVVDQIKVSVPADELFEERMTQHSPSSSVAAYALRRIELALSPTRERSVTNRSQVNVEHIMPKGATAYWRARINRGSDYETVVGLWGNLTLLDAGINKTLKNAEWSDKLNGLRRPTRSRAKPRGGSSAGRRAVKKQLKSYRESELLLTKALLGISDWNEDQVVARTAWIATAATKIWRAEGRAAIPAYRPSEDDSTKTKTTRRKTTRRKATKTKATRRRTIKAKTTRRKTTKAKTSRAKRRETT